MSEVYQGDQDHASSYQGVLSPDGTHAAVVGPPQTGDDGRSGGARPPHRPRRCSCPALTTGVNPNAQVAWTANSRWLVALTDNQLRAYDTTTRTLRTLPVGEPLQHLVSANAAGI